MRQVNFLPIVIMALNLGTEEEEKRVFAQHGFNAVKPLEGVYKGSKERSWLIPATEGLHVAALKRIAKRYKQESVLFVAQDRQATLLILNENIVDKEVKLGYLHAVSEEYAKSKDCYTFDPSSRQYWRAE